MIPLFVNRYYYPSLLSVVCRFLVPDVITRWDCSLIEQGINNAGTYGKLKGIGITSANGEIPFIYFIQFLVAAGAPFILYHYPLCIAAAAALHSFAYRICCCTHYDWLSVCWYYM